MIRLRDVVDTAACTIISSNYLALSRVLANSYLKEHPGHYFVLVVIDQHYLDISMFEAGTRFRGVDWLRECAPDFNLMAAIYDVTEFATSLKPFVLKGLLSEYRTVTYIDPDIKVYGSIEQLISRTEEFGISLTPHCLEPMARDGKSPREADIMMSGVYNLGYIGVSRSSTEFLNWWCERLRRDSISDPERQLFTDQRWIDLAVPIFQPYIESDPGYNVAYWNIDQRPLTASNGRVYVLDSPLKFFHFSGFDATKPWWLSKHAGDNPRFLVGGSPVLSELCDDYASEVRKSKLLFPAVGRYRWDEPIPGFCLPKEMRRYLRRELIESDKGNGQIPTGPFEGSPRGFLDWLVSCPHPGSRPRYIEMILESRPDIRDYFGASLAMGDYGPFLDWVATYGTGDYPWLVLLNRGLSTGVESDSTGHPERSSHQSLSGLDLVGYLRSEHGVGEAGRLVASALWSVGYDVSLVSSGRTITRQGIALEREGVLSHRIKLLSVNADQIGVVAADLGPGALDSSHVIGQWFWELEEFPSDFANAFEFVDEVWAATSFVAEAIRAVAPSHVKVSVMPLPIVEPATSPDFTRESLGLDDRFMFLFSFDFLSVAKRKNATGLIASYMAAFSEDDGAQLVIKCVNGSRKLRDLEEIRWLARERKDILIIDGYLDRNILASLMATADCYVSLHRSEGLGLTMSEAMCFGVPVIATGYSGNVDFMNSENSILVPWEYTKVGSGADPYRSDARWAEPDLSFAADAMRKIFDSPDDARRIGLAGRESVLREFSPEVCGQRMLKRLREIEKELSNA